MRVRLAASRAAKSGHHAGATAPDEALSDSEGPLFRDGLPVGGDQGRKPPPRRFDSATPDLGTRLASRAGMIPPLVIGAWERQHAAAERARLLREIAAERVRKALEVMRMT